MSRAAAVTTRAAMGFMFITNGFAIGVCCRWERLHGFLKTGLGLALL